MSDIADKLESRIHDSHMDTERLMDDAVVEIKVLEAIIQSLKDALEWAVAEIKGDTVYEDDRQFGRCLDRATEALDLEKKQHGLDNERGFRR